MALAVHPRPSLAERTTLKLGGTAMAEVMIETEADLENLAAVLDKLGGTPLVLGAGSNILARDGELPLVLVKVAGQEDGPSVVRAEAGRTTVTAGAGLRLPRLLGWLKTRGLSGLEGLTGIPGSVGGAVAMNAGSYGVEFTARLERIRIWTPRAGLKWLGRDGWEAGYRMFRPRVDREEGEPFLVWEVELTLDDRTPEEVRTAMAEPLAKKKATQPLNAASAGCVFKNPPGESAGRLLDRAGLRGYRLGGMAFSEMHANFLVNLGGGTSGEALELIELARTRVRDAFGIELALEVKIIPWR